MVSPAAGVEVVGRLRARPDVQLTDEVVEAVVEDDEIRLLAGRPRAARTARPPATSRPRVDRSCAPARGCLPTRRAARTPTGSCAGRAARRRTAPTPPKNQIDTGRRAHRWLVAHALAVAARWCTARRPSRAGSRGTSPSRRAGRPAPRASRPTTARCGMRAAARGRRCRRRRPRCHASRCSPRRRPTHHRGRRAAGARRPRPRWRGAGSVDGAGEPRRPGATSARSSAN